MNCGKVELIQKFYNLEEVTRVINKRREVLNLLVLGDAPFDEIYEVSIEIDTLISEYYRMSSGE